MDDQNQQATAINDIALGDETQAQAQPAQDWQHPGMPLDTATEPTQAPTATTVTITTPDDDAAPVVPEEEPVEQPQTPVEEPTFVPTEPAIVADPTHVPDATVYDAGSDDLLAIKQQALGGLTTIAQHLDQTPEERFRTTMMMLQATDNQDLIKVAYEAANAIEDEKTRAQALLDIVNEINYFTQAPQQD